MASYTIVLPEIEIVPACAVAGASNASSASVSDTLQHARLRLSFGERHVIRTAGSSPFLTV